MAGGNDDRTMSIIRINAITVPAQAGDELAHRFAARAGAVLEERRGPTRRLPAC